MAMTHIKKVLAKREQPTKRKAQRKSGKKGASKRRVVVPAVEGYALLGAFIFIPEAKHKKTKTNPQGAGRPTVMTTETIRKLEVSFSYDATVEEACLDAGISPNTYYEFLKKHPAFQDRVDALRQAPYLVLRKKVIQEGEHNADTALKFLERKKKMEFSTRSEVAHTGEIVDRHSVDPDTAALIRQAMSGFARKTKKMAETK